MGRVASSRTVEQERELFLRVQRDPAAIGDVYDEFADALYGFLYKRCGHKETAEDLVSHAFAKLLESAPTLEWRGVPLRAWLYQTASNALIDHFRKFSTIKERELDTDAFDPPAADDPAWSAQIAWEGAKLRDVLKTLSARDQQVLDLRFFAGLDAQEIAKMLDISENHAAVLVYRALGRLRNVAIHAKLV